ncbi:MAG: Coagulation factor 5/8 type domain-containing protein [Aquihabitans sp.]
MVGAVRRSVAGAVAVVAVSLIGLAACEPQPVKPVDIYAFAGGCYALKDETTGKTVVRDALGYTATGSKVANGTPFTLQATALGRYLLFGKGGQMIRTGTLSTVTSTTTPGPTADWTVKTQSDRLSLTNLSTGKGLTVGSGGRLAQGYAGEYRWSLVPTSGCTPFPEVEVGAVGTPFKGASPTAPVKGFLDAHTHISAFRFLGGKFHCGRPWSPYGVTVALEDCVDHQPNGAAAAAENLFATGVPVGTHDTDGWPTFKGWPRWDSLTHEGTYWKWIERAWRGGLRIVVNDLVENGALCEIYPLKAGTSCNEMDSIRLQAQDMYALQDYIDAQYKGPGKGFLRIAKTPAEARRYINDGKLVMVLGIEASEVLDCGRTGDTPHCTKAQIDQRLDEVYAMGVRSLFPVHKFDNALGGTAYDDGATGLLVNVGNKWATGEWWQPVPCAPGAEADNSPTNLSGEQELVYAVLGVGVAPLLGGDLPAYPPGPLCNPRGLTDLGIHVIEGMAKRGMIVETDHMSVKARKEALTVLERLGYSGLITSHSWGDATSQKRLQSLGGVVAPYARSTTQYAEAWAAAKANRSSKYLFGIGYGSDTNGLGKQTEPRADAATNKPVTYPYKTFDGGTTMLQSKSGTRLWDINVDGAANYGMFPDWIEDVRHIAGSQAVADMANGAEAYLQMWARADAAKVH